MKGVRDPQFIYEHSRTDLSLLSLEEKRARIAHQRKEANKRYTEKHPEKVKAAAERKRARTSYNYNERNTRLQRKYGITSEQWNVLFNVQNRCCAICKSTSPKSKWGWHTDHRHGGGVRGILCRACNITVGHVEKPHLDIILAYIEGTPHDRKARSIAASYSFASEEAQRHLSGSS